MPTYKPKSGLNTKYFQISLLTNGRTYAIMNLRTPVGLIGFLAKIEPMVLELSDALARSELKIYECGCGEASTPIIHVKFNSLNLTSVLNALRKQVSIQ